MFKLIDIDECEVMWEPVYGVPVFHFNLKPNIKWSVSLKKKVLGGLYFVRKMFGEEGFNHIYAICSYADDKLLKFSVLLGFEQWSYLNDEDGNHIYIVCRQPTIKGEN